MSAPQPPALHCRQPAAEVGPREAHKVDHHRRRRVGAPVRRRRRRVLPDPRLTRRRRLARRVGVRFGREQPRRREDGALFDARRRGERRLAQPVARRVERVRRAELRRLPRRAPPTSASSAESPGVVALLPSEPMRPTSSSLVHESMYTSRRRPTRAPCSASLVVEEAVRQHAVLELRAPLPLVPEDRHRRIVDEGERRRNRRAARRRGRRPPRWKYQTPPLTRARSGVEVGDHCDVGESALEVGPTDDRSG